MLFFPVLFSHTRATCTIFFLIHVYFSSIGFNTKYFIFMSHIWKHQSHILGYLFSDELCSRIANCRVLNLELHAHWRQKLTLLHNEEELTFVLFVDIYFLINVFLFYSSYSKLPKLLIVCWTITSVIDVSQLLSINHCSRAPFTAELLIVLIVRSISIRLLYGLDVHVVHEDRIPLFHHFTDLVKNIVLHANRCAIEHKHIFVS